MLLSDIVRIYQLGPCRLYTLQKMPLMPFPIFVFPHQQRLNFLDATPSPFSWSHKSTPQRHPSEQSHSTSTPSAVFPWARDDSRPAPRRQSPSSPQATSTDVTSCQQAQLEPSVCGKESDYRREPDSECRCQVNLMTFVFFSIAVFQCF